MIKLKSSWTFWYHDIKTDDWSRDSYIFIHKIKTLEELWGVLHNITVTHLKNGMYFIMREDVFPDWSDKENINGGCWSLKIPDTSTKDFFSWIIYLVREILCNNKDCIIQGVSYSPKYNHGILKIWNNDSIFNKMSLLNNELNTLGCKYTQFIKKK